MKKNRSPQSKSIRNQRARFDYNLEDSLVVGIVLSGAETKALRMGHGQLRGSYVALRGGELFLVNATIGSSNAIPISEGDQTRDRKLLAKKREIDSLVQAKQQGRTIVPLEILTGTRYIKVRISIGVGKKNYDKRQSLKARDENRQINHQLKQQR